MGTKGAIESVHIDGMSVLSSLNLERAFFPPGQSKVSVIIRFLYYKWVSIKKGLNVNGKLVCSYV